MNEGQSLCCAYRSMACHQQLPSSALFPTTSSPVCSKRHIDLERNPSDKNFQPGDCHFLIQCWSHCTDHFCLLLLLLVLCILEVCDPVTVSSGGLQPWERPQPFLRHTSLYLFCVYFPVNAFILWSLFMAVLFGALSIVLDSKYLVNICWKDE